MRSIEEGCCVVRQHTGLERVGYLRPSVMCIPPVVINRGTAMSLSRRGLLTFTRTAPQNWAKNP